MTDDDSRAQDENARDTEPSRSYPDHLLRDGRERGLSKADRRYLASSGETVDNKGTDVNTRMRLRERIRESIVDFWIVTEYLGEHDRGLIFRESDEQWDNWELQIGLKSAIQFFYTALGESDIADFETVLTSAVHDAEHRMRSGPALVDVDFEVEVDEQFRVEEAYQKFKRGVPLSPTEIGALLVTGKVDDVEEVQLLSRHARANSFIEHTVAPLLEQQLSSIGGESEKFDRFWYVWSHLSDEYPPETGSVPHVSDYQYLEDEITFQQHDSEDVTLDELADDAEEGTGVDGLDLSEELGRVVDDDTPTDYEATLRKLSDDLDVPITVGDDAVYISGRKHPMKFGEMPENEEPEETPPGEGNPVYLSPPSVSGEGSEDANDAAENGDTGTDADGADGSR